MNQRMRQRSKEDGADYYSREELDHFEWLGSEAVLPLRFIEGKPTAMIVLGHPDAGFFDHHRVAVLEICLSLIDAFFMMAIFAADRVEKARLLERVAAVLPLMASAESEVAFARAVCTVLSCKFGFLFDRALYFRMRDHALPAECLMAVGGIDDTWPAKREEIDGILPYRTLGELLQFVLENPLPQKPDGSETDPLFAAACGTQQPLMYREGESKPVDDFLTTGRGTGSGSVLRLSHQDLWIAKCHREREEMFFNRNDEFFVFALRPITPDSKSTAPLGFVVADLPYQPWKHQPVPGFPDLEMVSITLNLLAGLWEFRNDARSYFHILGAVGLLRHHGGRVIETVDWIRDRLRDVELSDRVAAEFENLRHQACAVARAKEIMESLRSSEGQVAPLHLKNALLKFAATMETRHLQKLPKVEVDCPSEWTVRIHPDAFDELLTCLVDNAVIHGSRDGAPVRVALTASHCLVPEVGGVQRERLLLTVVNDGNPVPVKLGSVLVCGPCFDSSEWPRIGAFVRAPTRQGLWWGRLFFAIRPSDICGRFGHFDSNSRAVRLFMCRILVVDDDRQRLSRIRDEVEELVPGCDVICHDSFLRAVAWLQAQELGVPLDLAIVDLYLTGEPPEDPGEGADLIRLIRQQFDHCPCILISSYVPLAKLERQFSDLPGVKFVSFHYTAQSMWGQLRQKIDDALTAHAAAAGSLH